MKILALDSTAIVASVSVCEDETLLAECTLNNGNTHSETLLPTVEFLLSQLSLTTDDIDLFAAAAGPGSFTGVRIGAATLKGLAFATGKPCIGVSSLESLAYTQIAHSGLICPVMNARRKQVYTALFRADGKHLVRLTEDSAISIAELDTLLAAYEEPVRLCGDGYEITAELLTHPMHHTPLRARYQSAYAVAQVARTLFAQGVRTSDIALAPTYLRLSQAERERAEKMKNTGI